MGGLVGVVIAPEAVSLAALLSGGLIALLITLVLIGIYKTYQWTLGALLAEIADALHKVPLVGKRLARAVDGINDRVLDTIGKAIIGSETAAAKFFHGLAWVWTETIDSIAMLAGATYEAVAGLRDGDIPRVVRERTTVIEHDVQRIDTRTRAREKAIQAAAATGIDRLQRDLAAEKLAREKGIDAVQAQVDARLDAMQDAAERAVADAKAWAARKVGGLTGRLDTLTHVVGAGAVAATALRVLDRSFPWYKCRNVRDFNRMLCRAPVGGLDDLLGLALVAVGPISIVAFARELQGLMGIAATAIHEWVIEE